jgi:hypothetical protein
MTQTRTFSCLSSPAPNGQCADKSALFAGRYLSQGLQSGCVLAILSSTPSSGRIRSQGFMQSTAAPDLVSTIAEGKYLSQVVQFLAFICLSPDTFLALFYLAIFENCS